MQVTITCFMSTSYEYCCRHETLFLYELVCLFLEHYLKIYCIYCNPSPLYISLGCHKQMHRQKKNNFQLRRTRRKNTTISTHCDGCQQKPEGEEPNLTMNNADISGWWWEVISSLEEAQICDAFFTCLECSVISWLTAHCLPSPPVPLSSSLYL